ncbi:hypothetical protein [Methylobacterium nodulans]|uniref:Uncharacterized protein n=1 Tax=Methylobacterium nodulans (strain LMG 21967 / CNCM I-2342 / ORS 2060) TaxID=460265 RepID=B8ILV6_METNO|nr:hypothetical protein [Methylobacterium nodulans]ACL62081.1 hypothetical protein Mnod_7342 [Methylobacterium nodulans ORS 2060]
MIDPLVQATQLRTFASRLRRLAPTRDPEAFVADKDQLVSDLERAASELKISGAVATALDAGRRGPIQFGVVAVDGRIVPVVPRHPTRQDR